MNELITDLDPTYKSLLGELKNNICSAQMKAAQAVNHELVNLYWSMGKKIAHNQAETRWGSRFLEMLSRDLQNAFPETQGFSVRNLKYMRAFALSYPDLQIGQQAVAQLPWSHIILLIQKVKDDSLKEWYANQCIENGWSRHALDNHIKQNLHSRQAISQEKASNYLFRLPAPQSQLAHEMLKNPYNFTFLGLHDDALEREIEHASIQHITKFLLELGKGFAFVGRQVPLEVDNEQFFIDMLFYNLKLRCFVVVEIKAGKFKPEHAGQLNFYLSAVDVQWKQPQDNPTIGLLLCKSRSKIIAEYALKDIDKPIGISEYELTKAIPEDLKPSLPSIEEIEAELNADDDVQKQRMAELNKDIHVGVEQLHNKQHVDGQTSREKMKRKIAAIDKAKE